MQAVEDDAAEDCHELLSLQRPSVAQRQWRLRDAAKSSCERCSSGGTHTTERRNGQGGSMMTEDAYTTQRRCAHSRCLTVWRQQ